MKTLLNLNCQDSRVIDLSLKEFCKTLNENGVIYMGPLLRLSKKTNGNIIHFRYIEFDSKSFNKNAPVIMGFNFPPSVETKFKENIQ